MTTSNALRDSLRAAIAQREKAHQSVVVSQRVLDNANGLVAECGATVSAYADVALEAAEARAAALASGDHAMTLPDHIKQRLVERERADGLLAQYIEARVVVAQHLAGRQGDLAAAENALTRAVAAVCANDAATVAHMLHECETVAAALRTQLHSIDAATPPNVPLPPVVVETMRTAPVNARAERDLMQVKAWHDYGTRLRTDADALPPATPLSQGSLDPAQAAAAERQARQARIETAVENGRQAQAVSRQHQREAGRI